MKTLLMLSGGPDSAAALWVAAKHGPVHCVHVRLAPEPSRMEAEEQAADRIAQYVREVTGQAITLDFCEWGIDWKLKGLIYDCYQLAGFEAVYAIAMNDITHIARIAIDETLIEPIRVMRRERASRAIENMVNLAVERNSPIRWFDPFGWPDPMTKKQVMDILPPELRKFTISCRSPEKKGNRWIPCGMCFKCKDELPNRPEPYLCGYTELVMLSGGPDSAVALWLAAQKGPTLAVHVLLGRDISKIKAEEWASHNICEYVRENSPFPVILEIVPYQIGNPDIYLQNDMNHLVAIRISYLLGYSDIKNIWRAAPAHDIEYHDKRGRTRESWMSFHEALCVDRKNWKWQDPFGWPQPMSKKEAMKLAPPEVSGMAISCCDPEENGNDEWTGCGKCYKCRGDWSYKMKGETD